MISFFKSIAWCFKKALGPLLLYCLLSPLSSGQIIVVPRYEIYLAVKSGDKYVKSKDDQFGCDDTIYLFLESSDKSLPGESLDAEWRNPVSGLRHKTSNPFALQKSGKRYWSWSGIEFQPGGSGPLNLLNLFLDPAAGREQFIGEWKVHAEVEGRFNKELSLTVLC